MPKSNPKQGVLRVMQRLEEINTSVNKCEENLNKINPTDFFQN